jgi:ribonuclease HI
MGYRYILHFDGCCKGNPGVSGAGVVIYKDDEELWSSSKYLGKGTNNQAEYKALILGLEKAVEFSITELCVFGDSQLVIKQVNGLYKVSSPQIKPLYEKVKELKRKFENVEFYHVYRDNNKRADKLANDALLYPSNNDIFNTE